MALHDPNLQLQAELDKLTRERAFAILAALKAGAPQNTAVMVADLGIALRDEETLAQIIQRTARGENALLWLLKDVALVEGKRQAESELASARCQTEAAHA